MSKEEANAYYRNKLVLITGSGDSISSELCRQLAKMDAKQIIILNIYKNGAYDVQQELKIAYGNRLDLQIELCSIADKDALKRVFTTYNPQIVINVAAHKHVPLIKITVLRRYKPMCLAPEIWCRCAKSSTLNGL